MHRLTAERPLFATTRFRPGLTNGIRERENAWSRNVYWQWTEEVYMTEPPGLLPCQVTDDYRVYADGPAAHGPDANRTGRWLVFVSARHIDRWWEQIRLATEQGRLGSLPRRR
jgi:hypothetical protein